MRTSNFGAEAEAEHSYFLLRNEPENFLINMFLSPQVFELIVLLDYSFIFIVSLFYTS